MALLNYKGKNSGTYQGVNETPLPVSIVQYILHYAYGVSEPTIMRLSASVLQSYKNADNQAKKKILEKLLKTLENTSDTGIKFMPHGIVLGRKAAENVIDFVYYVEGFRGGRLAVGPCICELANKKYPPGVTAPEYKDITLYYASDIYTNLPLGHRAITAEEAKEIMEEMHRRGYLHHVFYMFGKKSGAFVMCNCDRDICTPVSATRVLGEGLNCSKGPEICLRDPKLCLGPEACGECLRRCPFDANSVVNGQIVHDRTKCMGCELCVTTCKGHARQLEERKDYRLDHVMNRSLLLAGKYGRPALKPFDSDGAAGSGIGYDNKQTEA